MGLFNRSADRTAKQDSVRPLNLERLAPVLKELDLKFATTEDRIIAEWDNFRANFGVRGEMKEILFFSAVWDIRPPIDRYDDLAIATNKWRNSRHWPTVSVTRGEKYCKVRTDLAVDMETGTTDELLKSQIKCFVATTISFYDWFGEQFPEHVAWVDLSAE